MNDGAISGKQYYRSKIYPKLAFLRNPRSFFYYVLFLIILGFGFFGFALVTQSFTTPYSGDFSQQGFPFAYNFYDSWWEFFNTGKFPLWDFNTFLGADNIEANTFYGLFSPFMIPILLFPREMIPQSMALMSIARLVVGGLFFRLYLKYMGCSETTARIFSIAYAFMGWTAYYLWFNSFYEVATFLPLVLFGIEKVVREKKIWALSLGLFLLGISNYFFFITVGIFGVGYAVFRFFQTIKTRDVEGNFAVIGLGFLGFLFGFGASAVLTIPSILSSFTINRSETAMYWTNLSNAFHYKDWDTFFTLIFYCWNNNAASSLAGYDNYYFCSTFPLVSFFYPTISCRFVNIVHYKYFENTGSSIFIFTPCIILFFSSMFLSLKDRKISHFIAIAILATCLFVPFFYFLCGAFSVAYGRWEIVVAIMALMYAAKAFDRRSEIPRPVIIISGIAAFLGMLGSYFLATAQVEKFVNIVDIGPVIGIVIYEMVLCLVVTGLLAGFWKSKHLPKIITASIAVEVVVMGTLVANIHSLLNYDTTVNGGYNNVPTETAIINDINESDHSYFRIQSTRAYESNDNISMVEGYNGVSTFHSFYNNEVDDFQRMSQILQGDNSWSGTAYYKRTNLDEFLGVKYYLTKDSDTSYIYTENGVSTTVTFDPNVPLGYTRIDDASVNDGYRVYKNDYQIDFATSYDTIYYKHNCDGSVYNSFYPTVFSVSNLIRNEEAYFSGAILDDADVLDVKKVYPDMFNVVDGAPSREAQAVSTKLKGVYVNNEVNRLNFDPLNPERDIIETNRIVDPANSEISPSYFQIVFEPSGSDYFPIGVDGAYYMLSYPLRTGSTNYSASIFLIGEDADGNSKVVTYDTPHNNSRNRSAMIKGFYSLEKIKSIVVCPSSNYYLTSMPMYYEPFENCISRYQNAITNGVGNVVSNTDFFSFDSNYETNKFVITQVAYGKGWSVKATDSSGNITYPETYNSQGGFVGFVAPSGNIHYEMIYVTPNIGTGALVSAISLLGVGGITGAGIYLEKKKKKRLAMEPSNEPSSSSN